MKLSEPIVFLRLSFTLPGQTKKLPGSAAADAVEADARRVKSTARLYASKAFQKIVSHQSTIRKELESIGLPGVDIPGSLVIPRKLLQRALDTIERGQKERNGLVIGFLSDDYDAEIRRAQSELGQAFDATDYPPAEDTADKFEMKWSLFSLDVPEDLPPELRAQETAKLQAAITQVADDCRNALRSGMLDLVNHLVESLSPSPDGKRRRLYASTVEQLQSFLSTLSDRNLTSDAELEALGDKARNILAGATAESLKDSPRFAERVKQGLADVAAKVSTLVKTDGQRAFDFDDEAAAAPTDNPNALFA